MEDRRFLLNLGLIVACLAFSSAKSNYYTITFPNKARANSDFNVTITYHGIYASEHSQNLDVTVSITRAIDRTEMIEHDENGKDDIYYESIRETASKSVSVAPGETSQLSIKIESWRLGRYRVRTIGSGPIIFDHKKRINMVSKGISILIQTDKVLYQPTQLVRFRVLVLNDQLLPYNKEEVMVRITDQSGNIIKQWNNATLDHGIFQEQLQLSDQPVMGDWSITAHVGSEESNENKDKIKTTIFTIKEYVLPKFDVTIDVPYVTSKYNPDPTFVITTNAKYTFGRSVHGKLELTLEKLRCFRMTLIGELRLRCLIEHSLKIKTDIDGTSKVSLKPSDWNERAIASKHDSDLPTNKPHSVFLDILEPPTPLAVNSRGKLYRDTIVLVHAEVTEALTEIKINQTATVIIYADDVKLIIALPPSFKPGIPMQVTVKLLRQDNKPVTGSSGQVTLDCKKHPGSYEIYETQTNNVSLDGISVFTTKPPLDATKLTFEARYENLTHSESIDVAKSINNKYITVNSNTKSPQVGNPIEFEVITTFPMTNTLSYVVVARGNIYTSGRLVTNGQSVVNFDIPVTSIMMPRSRIVVYYTDSDSGETIADSVNINIEGIIGTPVSITTSKITLKPGENVTLTINSLPDSLVALQSLDMSVLLLKSGNSITQQKVLGELRKYNIGRDDKSERPNYRGQFEDIFKYCGLVLLTNGKHYLTESPWDQWNSRMENNSPRGFATIKHTSVVFDDESEPEITTEKAPKPDPKPEPEPVNVRTLFPETFIWTNINTKNETSTEITFTVPDTITTWIIDAYAINNNYGLGIMDKSRNITVYREFFIALNLPYSVVRNEIVALQVLIFNYQRNLSQVRVELDNTAGEFQFMKQDESVTTSEDGRKMIYIKQTNVTGATSFTFNIKPTTVGQINLNVRATSETAGDALIKPLLVKAEGSTEYFNNAVLIDLRKTKKYSKRVKIDIPIEAIPGSEFIEFSAIGDFMAPVLSNLKELIRMPTGCGEQNMINFVPDVVIMKYLQSSGSLTPELKGTLIDYLTLGYQRQLTYKHDDGSYSAFGAEDKVGSTWLTAFVLKSFNLAKPFIAIDDKVINDARNFLFKHQKSNGEFKEIGHILQTSMKGGSGPGVSLTAYCLIAILENQNEENMTQMSRLNSITKAVLFLERELDSIKSVYDLAIVTYALQLSPKSEMKDRAFKLLQNKQTRQGNQVYWKSTLSKPRGKYSYYEGPTTLDVEATSYALLTYAKRNLIGEYLPILRWLVSKRSSLGGYDNSQDTVMGIQAMATISRYFQGSPESRVQMTIDYLDKSQSFTLNKHNALVTQKTPLPKNVRSILIEAEGDGVAIGQLSWNYNVFIRDSNPSFNITTTVNPDGKEGYNLEVCARYLGEGTTNMVIVEMNTLSSFKWMKHSLPKVNSLVGLKRMDLTNGDTLATFYYDVIPGDDDTCIEVNEISTGDVTNLQDAKVSVYDYYENYKRGEAYYNLPK